MAKMAPTTVQALLLILCFSPSLMCHRVDSQLSLPLGRDAYAKRQVSTQICPQAAPGVDGTKIFMAACEQNPQNSINNCMDRLWNYENSSSIATCQRFYNQYRGCLAAPNGNEAGCSSQHKLWNACDDSYAYCGCFYNLPNDISNCANVELGIEEQAEIQSSVTATGPGPSMTTTPGSGAGGASGGSGQPTVTSPGPTFSPSFVPSGTLASTPLIPPGGSVSTVAAFTTQLPRMTPVTTDCTSGTSSFRCTTMATVSPQGSSPLVTGFVCQGGQCENQQPGYEYCVREMRAVTTMSV